MKIVTYKAEELNPFLPETKARYDEVVQYKKDFTTIAKSDNLLPLKPFMQELRLNRLSALSLVLNSSL